MNIIDSLDRLKKVLKVDEHDPDFTTDDHPFVGAHHTIRVLGCTDLVGNLGSQDGLIMQDAITRVMSEFRMYPTQYGINSVAALLEALSDEFEKVLPCWNKESAVDIKIKDLEVELELLKKAREEEKEDKDDE